MTFQELKQKLADLNNQKAVLLMLVEYIDADFRTIGSTQPKKAIKTDEGTLVPEAALEATNNKLVEQIRAIDVEIAGILSSNLQVPAPPAAQQGEPQ